MPSWGEIAQEINAFDPNVVLTPGLSKLDYVRRKYLVKMHAHTGRATILYASKWTAPSAGVPPGMLSIVPNDVHGFMEAVYGLKEKSLDLILHSPGGSPEAAEAIVLYLRAKFEHIRVIVPHMAMSAATMIACAADEIVLQTALGGRLVPAQAIIDQFEMAKSQSADPAQLRAWLPMLTQYGPDLLVTCGNATELSKKLVREWLTSYMFRTESGSCSKGRKYRRLACGPQAFYDPRSADIAPDSRRKGS